MKIVLGKLFFAVLWALTSLVPQSLFAQSYPSKPIRLIVPFSAGGPTDVVARIVSQNLSTILGETVVVENKPGASGFIGTEAVARAQPDGYTLLLITASTHAISPNLFKKLPYDAIKDFATVGQFTDASFSGKLRGLAVTGPKRTGAALDIPTVAETYPGFEVTVWQGVGAPAQTPRAIVDKLNAALCKMVGIPAVKEKFLSLGADPVCNTPEAFAKHIQKEINKWAGVVKRANIPMEG